MHWKTVEKQLKNITMSIPIVAVASWESRLQLPRNHSARQNWQFDGSWGQLSPVCLIVQVFLLSIIWLLTSFRHLFYWTFVPLVQAALDEFCVYWNQRTVWWESGKDMPSGHIPDGATAHPQFYGRIDCLICLPEDVLSDLWQYLADEVGPREDFWQFYPEDFVPVAKEVYLSVGCPELLFLTAWRVFTRMSDIIETNSLY